MNEIEKMYEKCNFEKSMGVGSPVALHPFTAEKQLELIKWLVHYIKQINITDAISGEFYFTAFGCIGDMKIDFEEALASLVNNLWQDLSAEEKQQVKGILE